MGVLDRLVTIVVTATLTSAAWVVAGGTAMDRAREASADAPPAAAPAVAAPGQPRAAAAPKPLPSAQPAIVRTGGMIIPVAGKTPRDLVDTFTQARSGGARLHDAIDIMAAEGTPVVAAAPGVVEKLFLSGAGGKTIYIRSADGQTIYYYAHLRDYQAGLAEGQQLAAGAPLGTVGHTGNADPGGPHLHFAVMQTTRQAKWWEPSVAVNPYPLLTRR